MKKYICDACPECELWDDDYGCQQEEKGGECPTLETPSINQNPVREILFRGKTKETGEWRYGFVAKHKYEFETEEVFVIEDEEGHWAEVIPETIGQFTGLLDRNGKRVFEGDIVAIDVCQKRERIDSDGNKLHVFEINKPKIQKTAVVEYCSKSGKFDTGTPEICFDFASDFYIIGNIHDNPELMEARR